MNNETKPPGKKVGPPRTSDPLLQLPLPEETPQEQPLETPEAEKLNAMPKSDSERSFKGSRLTRNALRRSTTPAPSARSTLPQAMVEEGAQKVVAEREKPKSPKKVAVITLESEAMSPGVVEPLSPPTTVVMSPPSRASSRRRRIRTLPQAELPPAELMEVNVASIVAGFKTLQLPLPKSATVRALKKAVRNHTRIRHFTLLFQGKELGPEDSSLKAHGVGEGATVNLQVVAQSGNSDREDIAQLLNLSKSLCELRGLLSAAPLMLMPPPPPNGSAKKVATPKKEDVEKEKRRREGENRSMRSKMDQVRQKIKKRPPGAQKKKDERESPRKATSPGRVRSPGSIVTSPRSTFSTASVSPQLEMEAEMKKPVRAKELLLYFDPPESLEEMQALRNDLFEPPETRAKLEKLKSEMDKTRCGFCRTRLLFSMREMRCKCQKAFCPKHRNPQTHRCSVDFKLTDRQHMREELTKPNSEKSKQDN